MESLASIPTSAEPLWLIDGFNALHACLMNQRSRTGWWKADQQTRVAIWLEEFAKARNVWLVFDAAKASSERCDQAQHSATLHFTPSADDYIVKTAQTYGSACCIVSADRSLADRARCHDAQVLRPWEFEEKYL